MMTKTTLLIPLAASLMLGTAAFAQSNPAQSTKGGMPIDQETSVNGIHAACTGVGDQQENSARWSAYPVKVVVSGTGHQFFSGETVSITKSDGSQVAQMTCNAPWVLMKLEPGAYKATVDLPGHPAKTVAFNAPSSGQREVNVIYRNNELANDTAMPTQHRATDTNFTQPQPKPMDDTTTGNGAVDQPPQQPQ